MILDEGQDLNEFYQLAKKGGVMRGIKNLWDILDKGRPVVIFTILVPLTIASIYISYGELYFANWSPLRSSMIISLLTCLWPYTARAGVAAVAITTGGYVLMGVPCEFLLIYPGIKRLGVWSDDKAAIILLILMVVHGIGFNFVARWVRKTDGREQIK